jgi:F-type H+-transporting ATPase subunit b
MKRIALLLMLAGATVWAQEHAEPAKEGHEAAGHETGGHEASDPTLPAKWVNFAILASGLGFLAIKFGGPALKGQQEQILDKMSQASRRAEAAKVQAAEMDKRISGLQVEVDAIRQKAATELAAEAARLEKETEQLLAKVEHTAEQEIASAAKFATQQLKATAAKLAVELAGQKIRARMTAGTQGVLVDRFTQHLGDSRELRG